MTCPSRHPKSLLRGVRAAVRQALATASVRFATYPVRRAIGSVVDALESRCLFVASFDLTQLTQLRDDPRYVDVDGSGVTVAVLDSGIFAKNPDLSGNVVGFYNAVADPVNTPYAPASVNAAFDLDGHGSHTAGIAASSNPDIGVAYASRIVSVKVLASPGEKQLGGSPLVRGLQWLKLNAAGLGVRVVNLSVGTATNINAVSSAEENGEIARLVDDLEALGITVVASSGNSYAQYAAPGTTSIAAVSTISVANAWATNGRPENLNTPRGGSGDRYLAIEGSGAPDRLAATTQRSTLANQVVAPGQDIRSTWNGVSADGTDGRYKSVSGTSMAAPFVAGLVALMQDAAFTYGGQYLSDPAQIRDILRATADLVRDVDVADNNRYDSQTGQLLPLPETDLVFRRVNALKAVQRVIEIVTAGNPSPGQPGTVTDANAVRTGAIAIPALNATRAFDYQGSIGRDGLVDLGADDVDLYRVNLQTRGNLTVRLTRPDGTPAVAGAIRLFNAAGTEIAVAAGTTGSYPTLETDPFAPLNTGVYYVGISGAENVAYDVVGGTGAVPAAGTGGYRLSISLSNPDPDGVTQGATEVDLTTPTVAVADPAGSGRTITLNRLNGLLGSDPSSVGNAGRVKVDADVDMYRVVAPDNGRLEIDIDAESLYGRDAADTYVKVYDGNLTLLAENDDDAGSTDSRLSLTVSRSQVYYVAITVFGNRSFDASDPYASRTPNSTPTDKSYDLLLWLNNNDTNGTARSATAATAGTTISGRVGSDSNAVGGGNAPSKDVDWFRYVAASSGLLEFTLGGSGGFTPSLSLWSLDAGGTQITRIDDAALGVNPSATTVAIRVAAGQTVYASVTGQGNSDFNWFSVGSGRGGTVGNYTLGSALQADAAFFARTNDSVEQRTPTVLSAGQRVDEAVGTDGDVVIGAADLDLFSFTPESNANVVLRTIASSEDDADTYLRLFDADGTQIAFNDNATTDGKGSTINAKLSAGKTYYIGVNGASAQAGAYYPLTGAGATNGSTGRYGLLLEVLPSNLVPITFGGKDIASYTDGNGQPVTIRIAGPGSGSLLYNPDDPTDFELTLTGTTAASRLIVKGTTVFGDVRIDGPIKAFSGAGVTLDGDWSIGGDVRSLVIAGAANSGTLTAASIGALRAGGDFGADVAVGGDLSSVAIGGDLTAGEWDVDGAVKSLTADEARADWSAAVGGGVTTVRLNSLSGGLSAGSFGKITVRTGIADADVRATAGGVKAISAASFDRSTLRSAADIGKVTFASASDSNVFAAVAGTVQDRPQTSADFTGAATIGRIIVKQGPFSGTTIAAPTIGSAVLNGVEADNSGSPFGLAAGQIDALSVEDGPRWRRGEPPVVSSPLGDFQIVVLTP